MHRLYTFTLLFFWFSLFSLLAACDPMMPYAAPTPQVIIVTAPPTATRPATATPTPTRLPTLTPTPADTPTPTGEPCEQENGEVLAFDRFPSEVAGENLRYRVYVPPCYQQSQRRYPVLYLLHGASYNERHWEQVGVIEAAEQGRRLGVLGPLLIVMPYLGAIGNRDSFPPDTSYESVVLEELIPAVDRDFCTWSDRQHRAIGGISRGGFWAYTLALRHPDVFGIVGGHSAFFDEDSAPPANNPLDLALNGAFLEDANLRLYLDNGAADPAGTELQLFSSRLSSRGIPHTYLINPVGGHDNDYWSAHVAEYLQFYTEDWPKTAGELPSCLVPSP